VSLAGLGSGYVSQAHSCVLSERTNHPPLTVEDLRTGWIYSNILNNNFGTNFPVTQTGDVFFSYVITTCAGDVPDYEAAAFGWEAVCPLRTIYTDGKAGGSLPASASFAEIDSEKIVMLAFKKSEDGKGFIMRLWNMSDETVSSRIHLPLMKIRAVSPVTIVEEAQDRAIDHDDTSFTVTIAKREILNLLMDVEYA
jgi:alpha-mannosidase